MATVTTAEALKQTWERKEGWEGLEVLGEERAPQGEKQVEQARMSPQSLPSPQLTQQSPGLASHPSKKEEAPAATW